MTVTAGRKISGQNQLVLRALEERGREGLTAREASRMLDIDRLGARVWDLRHLFGVLISEKIVTTPAGAKVARYFLVDRPVAAAPMTGTQTPVWGGIEQFQAEDR